MVNCKLAHRPELLVSRKPTLNGDFRFHQHRRTNNGSQAARPRQADPGHIQDAIIAEKHDVMTTLENLALSCFDCNYEVECRLSFSLNWKRLDQFVPSIKNPTKVGVMSTFCAWLHDYLSFLFFSSCIFYLFLCVQMDAKKLDSPAHPRWPFGITDMRNQAVSSEKQTGKPNGWAQKEGFWRAFLDGLLCERVQVGSAEQGAGNRKRGARSREEGTAYSQPLSIAGYSGRAGYVLDFRQSSFFSRFPRQKLPILLHPFGCKIFSHSHPVSLDATHRKPTQMAGI